MTILAILLLAIAGWDYFLGATPNSPKVPIVGNYLTHTIDFILVGVAVFLLFVRRK